MTADARIDGLEDFWTRHFAGYLNQHRHPLNRAVHMIGIPILIATAVLALILADWRMLVGGQLVGWAIQIAGHKIEGNRPALLQSPAAFVMGPLLVLVELAELVGLHFDFADRARRVVFGGGDSK